MNEKYIETLRTPYFYIDTSIIIQNNFNFNSWKFKQLLHFIKIGRIKLLFNKITINEIKNNIGKEYEPVRRWSFLKLSIMTLYG